jgi:hypothetical protein
MDNPLKEYEIRQDKASPAARVVVAGVVADDIVHSLADRVKSPCNRLRASLDFWEQTERQKCSRL